MTTFFLLLRDVGFAAIVAIGFALLFNAPKNSLWAAALLGGLGHSLRFMMHDYFSLGIITSTLCGAVFIGLAGIYLAHKVHTPPDVFTIPACITMIPGLFAYRTMLGFIKIADEKTNTDTGVLPETAHNFVLTSSLLFTLAIGICIGALLFRQKSAKHIKIKRKPRFKNSP